MIPRIERVATRCSVAAERHWVLLVVAFSVLFFWTAIVRANMKPFWHDEIYTIALAELPSVRTIWAGEHAGLDGMPPLNALATHALFAIAGTGRVTTRLPGMVGFWITTLVCFAIVRRRANAVAGLMAMLILSLTATFSDAYEARGYGIMLGVFSLALLSWSEAARGQRRSLYLTLLAFTLAAGVWTHYYAVLSVVPILAGEAIRLGRRRTLDWGVITSLVCAGIMILPLYSMARAAFLQSGTYWRHARFVDLWETYPSIMGHLFSLWTLGPVVGMAALSFILGTGRRREWARIPAHEAVAGLATLLIPIMAVLIGIFMIGSFVPRYALSGVVGFVVIVPLVMWRLGPRNGLGELLVCVCLLARFGYVARDVRPTQTLAFESPINSWPLLLADLRRSIPVVVTGILFLQVWYYLPPKDRRWLYYLADRDAALKSLGTDSLDVDYLALRKWYPVGVEDYSAFVAEHSTFRLYAVEALTWLPSRLREDGADVHEVGTESWATVYDVTVR